MGNGDLGWVGKVQSVQTSFGCRLEDEAASQETVNEMLKNGWRLIAIVNDTKLVRTQSGDQQVTMSYFILGRSS